MLVGRERELGRAEAVLASARSGRGAALVVSGEAGIGKTALLEAVIRRARHITVLLTRGQENETALLFAGLADLLGPILGLAAQIPPPQAAALRGALALEAPSPGDRFAVCAATLALMRAASDKGPVLVVVDDAQWVDAPSLECIGYAGRRIIGLRAAVLIGLRTSGAALPALRGIDTLELGPLADADAATLLDRAEPDLAEPARSLVLSGAAGNPLGLIELPSMLSAEERLGGRVPDLPLMPTEAIRQAFEGRLGRLQRTAQRALLLVAAAEPSRIDVVMAASRELGLEDSSLEAAEASGLVRLDGGSIQFSHPLARSSVYHHAPAAARREAHRALATATGGEMRAWHLAAGATGTDEEAARALEEVGWAGMARRGYAAASSAFERAAALTEPGDRRAGRLLGSSAAAAAAGKLTHALDLLDDADKQARERSLRASVGEQRAMVRMLTGPASVAVDQLTEAARPLARTDRSRAAGILAHAALSATAASDCRKALRIATWARRLLPADAGVETTALVLAALGWCQELRGLAAEASLTLSAVQRLAGSIPPHSPAAGAVLIALDTYVMVTDPAEARVICLEQAAAMREAGALHGVPYVLSLAAMAGSWIGAWAESEGDALEATAVARETGQQPALGYALTYLASAYGAQGREAECRSAAAEATRIGEEMGLGSVKLYALSALGLLELSLSRIPEAIELLEMTDRGVAQDGMNQPTLLPYAPNLVEAYVRAGRTAEAARALASFNAKVRRSGGTWATGAVARLHGMLREPFDAAFATALELHDQGLPFERARTLLAYAERLRRHGRRAEARPLLREAAEIFDRLGAVPWHERARDELRAAGAITRNKAPIDQLTAQERRVAEAVARGDRNREIAAALFLSPRTVESHLEQIYRKLELRSRSQLAAYVAAGQLGD